ncbi:MAG: Sporulation protein [Firmicutes bacterium]|nr:Sporulation protein [Bacillota bacterium]
MSGESVTQSIEVLFENLENLVSSKTVFGEPITIGEVVLVPIVDIAFGAGAGGGIGEKTGERSQGSGGGAAGAKMSASAVLVVRGSEVQVLKLKNVAAADRLLEMVPDFLHSLKKKDKSKVENNGEMPEKITS